MAGHGGGHGEKLAVHAARRSMPDRDKDGYVQEAVDRLGATAQSYGQVYNACSHTYLMVRDSATHELVSARLG
jgi:hypothetical protein